MTIEQLDSILTIVTYTTCFAVSLWVVFQLVAFRSK